MTEEPLYQDGELKITYFNGPEDHELFIKENRYIIQRGILRDLAETPRGGLISIIENWSPQILLGLESAGISVDGLHVAICQAYAEEERRVAKFVEAVLPEKK